MQVRRRCRSSALSPSTFCLAVAALAATVGSSAFARGAEPPAPAERAERVEREKPVANPRLDRSGRKRVGKASIYARKFHGRRMADGTRMDARDDNAASKTLPLGTRARVTHLETGKSATVTIQDRGPYVKGRIVDLSPATAEQIGITREEGVAPVEVAPISVPPPDRETRD
jgi:rare lipoprotein A